MNTDGSKFTNKKIAIVNLIGVAGWILGLLITGIDTVWSIPIGVAFAILPAMMVHYSMN